MAEELGHPADLRPRAVEVSDPGEVALAQKVAREVVAALSFGEIEGERIVVVASELATNLARHAHGGILRFAATRDGTRVGIQIESEDHGPGIDDPERALTDGYSTAGGLGLGLGTVNRLMDELEFSSVPGGGTRVTCRRWLRPPGPAVFPHPLRFGVATRSRGQLPENGDAFVVKSWPGQALAGVIDGLGHGELAQRAAQAARLFVEDHFDLPLQDVFAGADRACRGTRGVVMALARFDLERGSFRMANVGNIEARLLGSPDSHDFVVRRGVLGLSAPRPVVTEHRWAPDSILVLHSDGLHSRWGWHDLPVGVWESAGEAAQLLLRTQAREDDDATVVVVRSADHDR